MSILNVWLDQSTALVGVDTDAVLPGVGRVSVAKMIPMVNANCVLACRGNSLLLALVFVTLNARGDSYDSLAGVLPDVVKKAYGESGLSKLPGGHEILLVGYSDSAGRMRCIEVVTEGESSDFSVSNTERHFITPWHESLKDAPDPSNMAAMLELSRRQTELIATLGDDAAGGGFAVMAYMNQYGLAIKRNKIPARGF